MVADTFPRVLPEILAHEGGWSDDPRDPGGATMHGITLERYREYTKNPTATKTELRNISDALVAEIYRNAYWNVVHGDDLPAGTDYATMDGGVNSGPGRGAKWLQKAVGVAQDGAVEPKTVAAANAAPDKVVVVKAICAARQGFLNGLSTFAVFGKGWTRRVADVEAASVILATQAAGHSPEVVKQTVAAEQAAATTSATNNRNASAASTVTAAGAGGSQVDPSVAEHVSGWLAAGIIVCLVIATAVFLWRWHVNNTRAAAYAAAAAKV